LTEEYQQQCTSQAGSLLVKLIGNNSLMIYFKKAQIKIQNFEK
jgi:hypothetical protein